MMNFIEARFQLGVCKFRKRKQGPVLHTLSVSFLHQHTLPPSTLGIGIPALPNIAIKDMEVPLALKPPPLSLIT